MRRSAFASALVALTLQVALGGQHAGPNSNVNVFTDDPRTGDRFLQRQVEPAIAASPLNPEIVMAAANDYRLISAPDDQGAGEGETLETLARLKLGPDARLLAQDTARDTWIGLYYSTDRGTTWMNQLHPGHIFDTSSIGRSLPIYGKTAATDPVLAAFGRYFFLTALFFDRGGNSQLTVSRFVNRNDGHAHPVSFRGLVEIDKGSQTANGYFVDKPNIAVDTFRPGLTQRECNVYVAYTVFNGSSQSHLRIARSFDCGRTFSTPKNVANPGIRNQGANIAVDPNTGAVYVVWRTFNPHQILFARSTNGGASWTPPASVVPATQAPLCAYDQPTCPLDSGKCGNAAGDLARSLGLPSAVVDGNSRLHVVWQERVQANGQPVDAGLCATTPQVYLPRIVRASTADNGLTWSPREAVDFQDRCERQEAGTGPVETACTEEGVTRRKAGAQTKPSIARAGNRLAVTYKEARFLGLESIDPLTTTGYPLGRGRRYDLRLAWLGPAGPAVSSAQVSRYRTDPEGNIRKRSDGADEVSRDNLPMYKGGLAAFAGDYDHLAALYPMKPAWSWAGSADAPSPSFLAAWYDTRDVLFPVDGSGKRSINGAWSVYDPPGSGAPTCNAGTRDSNIYVSEIDDGLAVGAPQNFRPLARTVGEVTYPVYLRNRTGGQRTYVLSIETAPGVKASFRTMYDGAPDTTMTKTVHARGSVVITVHATGPNPAPPDAIRVLVDDRGTALNPDAIVRLNPDPDNDPPRDTTTLSRETHRASISNPTVFKGRVKVPGTSNPDFGNPDFGNPDLGNPDLGNPDLGNATLGEEGYTEYTDTTFTVTNTEGNVTSAYTPFVMFGDKEHLLKHHRLQVIVTRTVTSAAATEDCQAAIQRASQVISSMTATQQNPDFGNPDLGNPDFGNPDFGNPDFGNPDFGNPDLGNPDFGNGAFIAAPDDVSGSSHQPDGPVHSAKPVERVHITIRAWHCRVAGACGDGVEAEDPAHESFPGTPAEVGGVITLLVVPQARDNIEGVLQPHPSIAAYGPDLRIDGSPSLGGTTYAPGGTVQVPSWAELNAGNARAGARSYAYYFSADAALSPDDARLARLDVPEPLEAGGRRLVTGDSVVLPSGIGRGDYFLLIAADDGDAVSETDETNNSGAMALRVLPLALAFEQQPNDASAGQPITPAVKVVARDEHGNAVANVQVQMTASIDGTTVPLSGTTLVTTGGGGVATFADLAVGSDDLAGVRLSATAGDPRVESNTFNVGSISFEIYPPPGAQSTCDDCDVRDEFAPRGLRIGFTRDASTGGGVETGARLLETTLVVDEGTVANHSVTAPKLVPGSTVETHASGVLTLTYPDGPRSVRFRVRGAGAAADRLVVVGVGNDSAQVQGQQVRSTYTDFNGVAREQVEITFTHAPGLAQVRVAVGLDPLYVDNVRIVQ